MLKRSLGLCLFVSTQAALAQPAPTPKPVAPSANPAAPAAGPAAPVAPNGAQATAAEPSLPQVTDDMLAPVPPAARVLGSWREALKVLRENSSTLRTARAQEQVAEAQSRQVLSGSLPVLTADAGITRHLLRGEGSFPSGPITQRTDGAGNPLPIYDLGSSTSTIPDPATTWQAGLNLRIPVLSLDTWHRRGTAEAQIEVTKLNTKAA
jgi:outer membrane protein TolC